MQYDPFVDGVASPVDEDVTVTNPATGAAIGTVGKGTAADARRATDAARDAAAAWRDSAPSERERALRTVADRIEESADELARLLAEETGKCIATAEGEVAETVQQFCFYAGVADKVRGDTVPTTANRLNYTRRVPYGVTAHVIPWNYPLLLGSRGVAAALATGNAVVAKPPTLAPLTTMYYGELLLEELPAGTVNFVPGPGSDVGNALVDSPEVDLVTFTGSTSVGIRVLESAAANVTPADVELGGNTPAVVLPDADVENAARGVVSGMFSNAGQNCVATARLVVHEDVRDELVPRVVELAERLRLGPGIDPETDMGPVISEEARETVLRHVERGKAEGATLLTGGHRPDDPDLQDGYFVEPTVFDDVTNDMRIAREEIFGPVLCVITVDSTDEAVEVANDSQFALAASLWTDGLDATRLADRLDHGMVTVNTFPVSMPQSPWGGNGRSGVGRSGGIEGAEAFTRVDSVIVERDPMSEP